MVKVTRVSLGVAAVAVSPTEPNGAGTGAAGLQEGEAEIGGDTTCRVHCGVERKKITDDGYSNSGGYVSFVVR